MQTEISRCKTISARAFHWMVAILLAAVAGLYGQVNTGSILGTVTDASGAAIADATVQVKNVGTAVTTSIQSDTQGRFNVPSLNIGDYEVTAAKTGFQTVVRKGVTLTVGGSFV